MFKSKVVIDASPLIYLAILKQFPLPQELFADVYIAEAVYHKVVVQGSGQPGAEETQSAIKDNWIRPIAVQNRVAVDALLDELDPGEVETIVLAREPNLDRVLLDDQAARNKARLMGLQVSSTIGVLMLARQAGIDIDLAHELEALLQHNFRIAPQLHRRIIDEQTA
jgi:predicted nucleic acid-binding protein